MLLLAASCASPSAATGTRPWLCRGSSCPGETQSLGPPLLPPWLGCGVSTAHEAHTHHSSARPLSTHGHVRDEATPLSSSRAPAEPPEGRLCHARGCGTKRQRLAQCLKVPSMTLQSPEPQPGLVGRGFQWPSRPRCHSGWDWTHYLVRGGPQTQSSCTKALSSFCFNVFSNVNNMK